MFKICKNVRIKKIVFFICAVKMQDTGFPLYVKWSKMVYQEK